MGGGGAVVGVGAEVEARMVEGLVWHGGSTNVFRGVEGDGWERQADEVGRVDDRQRRRICHLAHGRGACRGGCRFHQQAPWITR